MQCGVIDVIPNATSRDEMGRAKINDLQSFFVMKYGPLDSPEFQKARGNFVQSMAAYSLLCYIVQIKDRHNGNIMIDGRGCITHIDFGFLFDIGPGGVKFEPNSFKLSHEMVVLMGGKDSVGFRQFRELTVKAFLAARPYAHSIVDTAALMLAAEFPSFKGEGTLERLKLRFRLDLSEKKAAEFMMAIIDNACENKRSIVYDEFQRMTNGASLPLLAHGPLLARPSPRPLTDALSLSLARRHPVRAVERRASGSRSATQQVLELALQRRRGEERAAELQERRGAAPC